MITIQTVWLIILLLFVAIGCYIIGIRRGWKTYEHDYDEGYLAGWNDAVQKNETLRTLINGLDEAFEDEDNNIIDGGSY